LKRTRKNKLKIKTLFNDTNNMNVISASKAVTMMT
jgi:hypothetical protein